MSESSFVNVNFNKQQDQRVTLEVQKWQVACDVRVLSNLKFTSVQISTTKELPRSDSIATSALDARDGLVEGFLHRIGRSQPCWWMELHATKGGLVGNTDVT